MTAAFVLLLFSPFGPISDHFIPYHPIGWAGMFVYFAMILSFNQEFERTGDVFWYVVTLGFFPLFISDLYFFPIPRFFGLGMLEWAGVQFLVFSVAFVFCSRVRFLRYVNMVMLMLVPGVAAAWLLPAQGGVLNIFRAMPLLFLFVTAFSLSYPAFLQKEYLFVVGTVLNFMVANIVSTLYVTTGFLPFGWSQQFMAVVTDRAAVFGRILMALSGRLPKSQA
jgi:hypothetical protein